ncbi:hypothetical protein GCM10018791_17270 [Streptomyces zaomyceticus]|nr:hypothetical protein GCM10018791_17270 [Streptomyces zaomyceticus]
MDEHLPGHDDEGDERREESRPPWNRGGGSRAAEGIGSPRAPGGVGRAAVRSVRSPGARGSGGVRDGTVWAGLGRLRPGCFSHLQKPYVREEGTDSRKRIPPSAPHRVFTRSVRSAIGSEIGSRPDPDQT